MQWVLPTGCLEVALLIAVFVNSDGNAKAN
jgi:hypothetical protein